MFLHAKRARSGAPLQAEPIAQKGGFAHGKPFDLVQIGGHTEGSRTELYVGRADCQ
jgi:hypothetical protein